MERFQFLDLDFLINIVDDELNLNYNSLVADENATKQLQLYLLGPLQTIRFGMLSDLLAVADTWRAIRSDEVVFDVVTGITITLNMYANGIVPDGWDRLTRLVVSAFSIFNNEKTIAQHSVIADTEELERFGNTILLQQVIASNPWLVTLFLMRRSPFVRSQIEQSGRMAARAQASRTT